MDIKKEISENNTLILLLPNKKYPVILNDINKTLSTTYSKICYISLNKSYNTVVNNLKKSGAKTDKFLFIDGVSKQSKQEKNVFYVSSPNAITELNITVNMALDTGNIRLVIFDSFSSFLAYEEAMTVIKFLHSMISTFRAYGTKCIFIFLKDDTKSDLITDLNMFADKVIEVKK